MPLVICIALGSNMGGHNATLPITGLLEMYANIANRAVVIGGGNEANQRHHFYGKAENVNDIKKAEVRVDGGMKGFTMELWTDIPILWQSPLYRLREKEFHGCQSVGE